MRLRSLLTLLCLAAFALPEAPASAQTVPRHRPRVTDPGETPSDDPNATSAPAPRKKKRKHATAIDDENAPPPAADEPVPAKKKRSAPPAEEGPTGSDASGGGDAPPPKKTKSVSTAAEDEESPRSTRARDTGDDGSDLRDESEHRTTRRVRTAEEELAPEVEKEEDLSREDEWGFGLGAEGALGATFLQNPVSGMLTGLTGGVYLTYGLGRALFAAEDEFLHNNLLLELSYLGTGTKVGTAQGVQVGAGTHYLSLGVLFGYPVPPVLFYAKFGPSMIVMPVDYDVQGSVTSFSGIKPGFVYGAGVRLGWYFSRHVGLAARVELLGLRRGYVNDLQLMGGLGLCF